MGSSKKGPFDIIESVALDFVQMVNPHGKPNSDVVRPWANGLDITRSPQHMWIIDFPPSITEHEAALYEKPFEYVLKTVKPERDKNKREAYRRRWWVHAEPRPALRAQLKDCIRFIATPTLSKYRLFAWLEPFTLPDQQLISFPTSSDLFFGVLHSRFHEVWALRQGTFLETRPRYTPTTCFETFLFPEPTDEQKVDISAAAKELNELRENWLNPLEWTTTRTLEFPGATDGPWSRFVVDPDARGIGTVRYPRVEPRDDDCAKKLVKRTLTNLYNERPQWLANAHAKLDRAVAGAYGFPGDITVLERLLALNQQRAADEKPAAKKQPRVSRAKTEEEFV